MPETEFGEVEGANEAVDRPNRIVRTDIVLDPRRKQTGLLAALAALERAIRHKPNRTCCSRKCPQFLPSLDGESDLFLRRGLDFQCAHRKVICPRVDLSHRELQSALAPSAKQLAARHWMRQPRE